MELCNFCAHNFVYKALYIKLNNSLYSIVIDVEDFVINFYVY